MKKILRILRYVVPYKNKLVFVFTFNIFSSIFSVFTFALIIPFLGILFGTFKKEYTNVPMSLSTDSVITNFKYLITHVIDTKGPATALAIMCGGILILYFLKTLFVYSSSFFMSPITTGVVCDLRNAIFKKILSLHLGFYSEERKGDIIARITNDVSEVEASVLRSLDMLFKDPVQIIIYLTTLIILNPKLTLFVLLMLLFTGVIIGRLGKTLRKSSSKVQMKLGFLMSMVEETLSGIRIISAFNAENRTYQKYRNHNEEFRKMVIRMWRRRDLASPLSEFLGACVIIVVIYFGGRLVLTGDKSFAAEAFMGYLIVFSQIINPAKSFSQSYYNVLRGYASIERIDHILETENLITDLPDAREIKTFDSSIEFRNVSFRYKEEYVLKDINLLVEKGKSIALVGQSGSGKSTLVDLIPRFYDVDQGEILVDGAGVKQLKLVDLRALMGNVTQESILFNDSIFNNIAFGVDYATMDQVVAAAKVANAHDFIMATEKGYDTNIGDRGSRLSGGQRQRVSIARAVLKNPPILILDEATSALDTESEFLVQEALTNLMKNRTSIVIAHRLSTIRSADEICVLHEGSIVERGKHEELLLQNGFYKKLYDLQMF